MLKKIDWQHVVLALGAMAAGVTALALVPLETWQAVLGGSGIAGLLALALRRRGAMKAPEGDVEVEQ